MSVRIKREHFVKVVEETLDSLPQEFRKRICNVAVFVEDLPPNQRSLQARATKRGWFWVSPNGDHDKEELLDLPSDPITSFFRRILKQPAPTTRNSANKPA